MTYYMDNLTLDEVLSRINFSKIETIRQGDGWFGTRYQIHIYNVRVSPIFKTFEEMRLWIIKECGYKLRCDED